MRAIKTIVIICIASVGLIVACTPSDRANGVREESDKVSEEVLSDKYPYTQAEVKAIVLPILEAIKVLDFEKFSQYFQMSAKILVTQEYGLYDYWWNRDDVLNIPKEDKLFSYFKEFIYFDYRKADFINYGFAMDMEDQWHRISTNDYQYENPLPEIMDEETSKWMKKNPAGRLIVQLTYNLPSMLESCYIYMDKFDGMWYLNSINKAQLPKE